MASVANLRAAGRPNRRMVVTSLPDARLAYLLTAEMYSTRGGAAVQRRAWGDERTQTGRAHARRHAHCVCVCVRRCAAGLELGLRRQAAAADSNNSINVALRPFVLHQSHVVVAVAQQDRYTCLPPLLLLLLMQAV